jgi:hypothetical protein
LKLPIDDTTADRRENVKENDEREEDIASEENGANVKIFIILL